MLKNIFFLLFSVFICFHSFSQDVAYYDSTISGPNSKITKMGWLEGNWKSSGQEITIQESWIRNGAYSMMCVASILENNEIILFEICTITEEEGTLVLRIRHFDKKLNAWEDKKTPLEKKLVKIEKNRFYFDGYTFEKTDKDQITLFIQSKPEDQLLTIPYIRN